MEWLGDNANRQHALFFSNARDHWRCARTGAAAHARGDEHHVAAVDVIGDFVHRFFRRRQTNLRFRTRAEAARDVHAELDDPIRLRVFKSLRIRVGDHEIDAFEVRRDHVIDRVAPRAANTNNGDFRTERVYMGWKM